MLHISIASRVPVERRSAKQDLKSETNKYLNFQKSQLPKLEVYRNLGDIGKAVCCGPPFYQWFLHLLWNTLDCANH